MRVAALLLLLVACWREPAQRTQPELSFVARVSTLSELRHRTDALEPQLDVTLQRILGLASEAERAAIHDDLTAMEREVTQLIRIARQARERGDDSTVLDDVDRKLARATVGVANLRDELVHAKTLVEQEAFEELKKKTEGTLDPAFDIRMRIYRKRDEVILPPVLQPQPLTP
ncbi:MAG TPA: hypothetical protein VIV11_04465 [Kofleriaceae bacterium]